MARRNIARTRVPNRKLTRTTQRRTASSRLTSSKTSSSREEEKSLLERLSLDFDQNQSYLNLILGGLILIVLAILLFNYFTKPEGDILSPQQTEQQTQTQQGDVSKDQLPGKYTVKDGDTLFSIAENYYQDGGKFTDIMKANNLSEQDSLQVGQVLEIPKVETAQAQNMSPSPSPEESPQAQAPTAPDAPTAPEAPRAPQAPSAQQDSDQGTGGAENVTTWGDKITGNTYTVQEGDWLSTIAGRAYGDIMAFQKIAQANNIQNPDVIEVGTVLKIPR